MTKPLFSDSSYMTTHIVAKYILDTFHQATTTSSILISQLPHALSSLILRLFTLHYLHLIGLLCPVVSLLLYHLDIVFLGCLGLQQHTMMGWLITKFHSQDNT